MFVFHRPRVEGLEGGQVHSQRVIWKRRKDTPFSESKREAERTGVDKINAQLERTMKAHIGCLNIWAVINLY